MLSDLILIGISLLYIVFIITILDVLEKYVSNEAVRYYSISLLTLLFFSLLAYENIYS